MKAPPASARSSSSFPPLLDLAVPEIFDLNAFRVLELSVEASGRDVSRRREFMEKATRHRLPLPPGPARVFPRSPAPDEHDIRLAAHTIQDAERRLAHEFFWFWPSAPNQAATDPALAQLREGGSSAAGTLWRREESSPANGSVARHNLAVLHLLAAVELEDSIANRTGRISSEGDAEGARRRDEAKAHWHESIKYWGRVSKDPGFWSRVRARIRQMGDRSLPESAARQIENALPEALSLLAARIAIRALGRGEADGAVCGLEAIQASQLSPAGIHEGLRLAVDPTRTRLKSACESAEAEAKANPSAANRPGERLLSVAGPLLATLDLVLPESHPARLAEHDRIAIAGLQCQIEYGNASKDWEGSLALLRRLLPIAASSAAKERLETNIQIVQGNLELGRCWFCGQNPGDEQCVHEVAMHGEVRTLAVPGGTRTTWSHTKVRVPRCRACQQEIGREGNAGAAGCLGILAGCAVWWFMGTRDLALPGFLIGVAIPIVLAWMAARSAKAAGRPGIVRREANDYPRIKELRAKSWGFGEKPPGIE